MVWDVLNRRKEVVRPDEPPAITETARDEIQKIIKKFPTTRAALLPALHEIQETNGYISTQAMIEIAEILQIPPADVFDTMSLYNHLSPRPKGRYMIMVCRGITCDICGAANLLETLKKKFGIEEHETTADGKFTLMAEDCLGGCEKAPYLLINEDAYGPVRPEDLDQILSNYP